MKIASDSLARRGTLAFLLLTLVASAIGVLSWSSAPEAQAAAPRKNAVVLVNSASAAFAEFEQRLQPFLDNFGMPYDVLDVASAPVGTGIGDYQLIVVGHTGLDAGTSFLSGGEERNISDAVAAGTGLFSVDGDLAAGQNQSRYSFIDDIFGFGYQGSYSTQSAISVPSAGHYITEAQEAPAQWPLRGAVEGDVVNAPGGVTTLASVGGKPLLLTAGSGQGRAVLWTSDDWIVPTTFGQFQGMDDMVWRGLVWAAQKPFVLRGMPAFVTMRVDDAQGAGGGTAPWAWVDVANQYGFRPFIPLFIDNVDAEEAARLRELTESGLATASVHANSSWDFFYWDHDSGTNLADETVAQYFADADDFLAANSLTSSKVIVGHFYETGDNVYDELAARGIEFVATTNRPGFPYFDSTPPLLAGPFREFGVPSTNTNQTFNVHIADWLEIAPGDPLNGQFFNLLTEVREDNYDLSPQRPSSVVIHDGTVQLKRALDSLVPASLFLHEYDLFPVSAQKWSGDLAAITSNIASYDPVYVTYDHAAQYARALATSSMTAATYDEATGELAASFSGDTDLDTQFYVFDGPPGNIQRTEVNVTSFAGGATRTVDLGGDVAAPSSQITAPASGETLAGSSFTIQGNASDAGGSGVAAVEVSTDGGQTWSLASGTANWSFSWALPTSGLHHILTRATDAAGNTELPGAGVLVTIEDTQPPVVSEADAINVFANGASIVWRTDEGADSQVEFGLTASYGSSTPLDEEPVVNHEVVLNGLDTETTYHYRVSSRDLAGNLTVSGDHVFTTTALPPPTGSVITFDDLADAGRALDGQYPVTVADWGSGQWYLSDPWGAFATNSVSFSGSDIDEATLSFLVPRRLVSVDAFNGGPESVTVTLSCYRNPPKVVTLAAGQSGTIATDWGPACSTVTIATSNNWNTNFDNFAHDGGGADVFGPLLADEQLGAASYRTATVTWTTDEPATSVVDFGTTTAYGATVSDPAITTSHSVELSGLDFGATYHIRVRSADADGNESAGADMTLTTLTPTPAGLQTTVADFATGATDGTAVSEDGGGEVRLAPALSDLFGGAAVDDGAWSLRDWSGGSVTVSGGAAVAQGAAIGSAAAFSGDVTFEAQATLSGDSWQQIGLASDLDGSLGGNRAVLSTKFGGAVYARTSVGHADTWTRLPGRLINASHTYRIERTASVVRYFVDGNLAVTHNSSVPGALSAWVSDYSSGGLPVVADWVRVTPYASSGTYTSGVVDTGDAGGAVSIAWNAQTPGGTSVEARVRTSADAMAWSAWSAPMANGGGVGGALGRYVQYQLTLATADTNVSPVIAAVTLSEGAAPTISDVQAAGITETTANIVWTTDTASDSEVEYGTTAGYGSTTPLDPSLVTSHSVALSDLVPGTLHHFRVRSVDANGNARTGEDQTFVTLPVTVGPIQNTVADFLAGTLNGVAVSEDGDGEVGLAPQFSDLFVGDALDGESWATVSWTGGAIALADGVATANGAGARSGEAFDIGSVFEAKATLGADAWQFVGLASDLDGSAGGNRAGFSTAWTSNTLFVRTSIGGADTWTAVSGSYVGSSHVYRIERDATDVRYYVDDELVVTHALAVPAQLFAWFSDYGNWAGSLSVDWLRVTPYLPSGTYVSGVVDAGDGASFSTISWTAETPVGTTLEVRTRTSGDGSTWSAWSAPATNGAAISSPSGRYLEYQLALTSSDSALTPLVDAVVVAP